MNQTRLYNKMHARLRNRMENYASRNQVDYRVEESKEAMLTTQEGIELDWMSTEYHKRLIRMKRKRITMTQMKALLRSEAKEKLVVSILDVKDLKEAESSKTIDRELAALMQACMELKRPARDDLGLSV